MGQEGRTEIFSWEACTLGVKEALERMMKIHDAALKKFGSERMALSIQQSLRAEGYEVSLQDVLDAKPEPVHDEEYEPPNPSSS